MRFSSKNSNPVQDSQLKKGLSGVMAFTTLVLIGAVIWNWQALNWPQWVWFLAYLVMFAIRMPHAKRNASNVIIANSNNAMESLMLTSMFLTMGLLPLFGLTVWGRFMAFADYELAQELAILGAFLMVPFLWLFWRSHADLGRNWSPGLEVHDRHQLITKGIYAHIRHPMYAALWLAVVAQPLLLTNWIYGALVFPAYLLMYIVRIPREEELLIKQFGPQYEDYMRKSGRIFPLWGQR